VRYSDVHTDQTMVGTETVEVRAGATTQVEHLALTRWTLGAPQVVEAELYNGLPEPSLLGSETSHAAQSAMLCRR